MTAVRLIMFGEALLPGANWVRRLTAPVRTERQVRFRLAFQVRVEKLVSDQHPMLAV